MIQKSQIVRWLRKLGRDVDLDHPTGAINDLIRWSQEESGEFWHELMKDLGVVWSTPYEKVLDASKGPEWADWFQGGGESDDGLSSTGIEALIVERADAKAAREARVRCTGYDRPGIVYRVTEARGGAGPGGAPS